MKRVLALLGVVLLLQQALGEAPARTNCRDFLFQYEATLHDFQPGQLARIWVPVPPSNEEQEVSLIRQSVPGKPVLEKETRFGNQILYTEATADAAGKISLSLEYKVRRFEVKGGRGFQKEDGKFLLPDTLVPSGGKPLEMLRDKQLPQGRVGTARALYDLVNSHMRYSKEGTGWGRGDAVWACENKYGNCSDFHSLFISLGRSQKIPARFEIGFPLPEKKGNSEIPGYHCWARFQDEKGSWIPVDISEANKNPALKDYLFGNLGANRVAFSMGRDLVLEPKQAGAPLNYFIYPYAESQGKPVSDVQIQKRFAIQDLSPGT